MYILYYLLMCDKFYGESLLITYKQSELTKMLQEIIKYKNDVKM